MAVFSVSDVLLKAKREKNMTFAQLGEALGHHPVWVAALLYGQAHPSPEEAATLLRVLDLDPELADMMQDYPTKGSLTETVPTDPFLYRFFEILQVYGMPMKAVTQEMFGDGIMSAIDFTMDIEKVEDPKGDRVKMTYNGKFLPYKKW